MSDSNKNCAVCNACYACDSCNACRACYACYACDSCRACDSCESVKNGIFCFHLEGAKNVIFNKQVTGKRFYEVRNEYQKKLGDWLPHQTNGYKLYKEAGCKWDKIDVSKLESVDWFESWKDMPQEVIDFIKSIPEFDADIFKSITGLDASISKRSVEDVLAGLSEEDKKSLK